MSAFKHFVVQRSMPGYGSRRTCICGWSSGWRKNGGRFPDHPHMQVTVSRTDLTPLPESECDLQVSDTPAGRIGTSGDNYNVDPPLRTRRPQPLPA